MNTHTHTYNTRMHSCWAFCWQGLLSVFLFSIKYWATFSWASFLCVCVAIFFKNSLKVRESVVVALFYYLGGLTAYMYALCVSGAVNTQSFVWKFFMRYIESGSIPSFLQVFISNFIRHDFPCFRFWSNFTASCIIVCVCVCVYD